ncbi:MAG: bifunctional diguanylate cyclase/phosphodiesterase, partial [Thiohalorhabdaceae bacterium]
MRDWQDYIKTLVLEINTVMEAYLLFSLFKVEEEAYELEIFWLHNPSQRTVDIVTEAVTTNLRQVSHFQGATDIAIHH